jgi:hypothetical protein
VQKRWSRGGRRREKIATAGRDRLDGRGRDALVPIFEGKDERGDADCPGTWGERWRDCLSDLLL